MLSLTVFGQEVAGTRKINEFGMLTNCCDFDARIDHASIEQQFNEGSKIFIVFYEGKHIETRKWDAKLLKSEPVLAKPPRYGFSELKKAVLEKLRFLKRDTGNFVFVNGGFRELRTVEFWLVPEGFEPPELTPTVDKKDIIYTRTSRYRVTYHCDGP